MKLHTFWLINLHYLTQVRKSMLQLQPSQCTIHCWQLVKINRPHGAEVFRSSKERLLLAPLFSFTEDITIFPSFPACFATPTVCLSISLLSSVCFRR